MNTPCPPTTEGTGHRIDPVTGILVVTTSTDSLVTIKDGVTGQAASVDGTGALKVTSSGGGGGGTVTQGPPNTPANAWPTTLVDSAGANVAAVSASGAVKVDATATTQPVSGTVSVGNFPATQPVSLATAPSTPVTGIFWQTTQPVSGAFWQTTQPVSGTFWQNTQPVSIVTMPSTPVTGTFWQSTQPVSLATNTPTLQASTAVIGHVIVDTAPTTAVTIASMPSTPVTGTFWQSTQPVSIASMPSTPVTGTFWQTTQPVSGTFFQGTQPISEADPYTPTNSLGRVTIIGEDQVADFGTRDLLSQMVIENRAQTFILANSLGYTGSLEELRSTLSTEMF